MFFIAIIIGVAASIVKFIADSGNSASLRFFSGMLYLVSAGMFIVNAFSIW